MKLHLTTADNQNLITAYGEGRVEVNKVGYEQALIVTANRIISPWLVSNVEPASDFNSLTEVAFAPLIEIKPEVVLLGTGGTHRFLHPKILRSLTENGIPLECMTTAAACRTYNILMAEGRHVAAALIL